LFLEGDFWDDEAGRETASASQKLDCFSSSRIQDDHDSETTQKYFVVSRFPPVEQLLSVTNTPLQPRSMERAAACSYARPPYSSPLVG